MLIFSLKSRHFSCKCRDKRCYVGEYRTQEKSFDINNKTLVAASGFGLTNKTENTNSLICLVPIPQVIVSYIKCVHLKKKKRIYLVYENS